MDSCYRKLGSILKLLRTIRKPRLTSITGCVREPGNSRAESVPISRLP